jgi:methionyl-tRNA synthetase
MHQNILKVCLFFWHEGDNMKICQSCGMPLQKPEDFGTNKDMTKNEEYCHYCFEAGKFTDEGISLQEKIVKNIEIAVRMGIPKEKATEMANTVLPKLKRWKLTRGI